MVYWIDQNGNIRAVQPRRRPGGRGRPAGPDGNPTGLNVELARLICEELKVGCTIQMRRFDTLLSALGENRGDAVIASIAPTSENRQRADFTAPYYLSPARFVARRDSAYNEVLPEQLEGKEGRRHCRNGATKFTSRRSSLKLNSSPIPTRLRRATRSAKAKSTFCSGTASNWHFRERQRFRGKNCCAFRGGAFTESRYFGDGIGIAVRRGNDTLRAALNYALSRLWETGRFTDLWLRDFPISPFCRGDIPRMVDTSPPARGSVSRL